MPPKPSKFNEQFTEIITKHELSRTESPAKVARWRSAEQIFRDNRLQWSIENSCHYILDWNFDEDSCRISKVYGSENITRRRRFTIGLLKSKGVCNVAQKMRQLSFLLAWFSII